MARNSSSSYWIFIIGGSGSGKTNALLHLIKNEPDIDKIYLYATNPSEAKYQLLINKRENTDLKYFNNSKSFIEYSNNMIDIYENIEDCNPNKKPKILIVFDDMIADMLSNKRIDPLVTELFTTSRKISISLIFVTQSYFAVPKDIRLKCTHYYIMKIPNKQVLKQTAFNHSSDTDFQDFMNLYKKCTAKTYPLLVIDTTLTSDKEYRD